MTYLKYLHIIIGLLLFIVPEVNAETSAIDHVETYGRIGYSIGGTAPLGMPAEIRKLNKFILQPNMSFGVDAYFVLSESKWGAIGGFRFENKGMHIDADVKNYHMEISKEGQSLEGNFTGKVDTRSTRWMFTIPIQAVYRISDKVRLKIGPYVSFATSQSFSGYAYNGYLRETDPTGSKVVLGDTEGTRGDYDFSEDLRIAQFGIDAGVDWMFMRRFGIYADLTWGLTGVHRSDFKVIEKRLFPIYGTVGIAYKIR